MTEPEATKPKYPTLRDYDVDHLLGGPESTRLEMNRAYYQSKIDSHNGTSTSLQGFFREHPRASRHRAIQSAAYIGLDFFERGDHELRPSGAEVRYTAAGDFAIAGYIASDRQPDFSVDQLPFAKNLNIPEAELREVARLATQHFVVFEAIRDTGEVPEL